MPFFLQVISAEETIQDFSVQRILFPFHCLIELISFTALLLYQQMHPLFKLTRIS